MASPKMLRIRWLLSGVAAIVIVGAVGLAVSVFADDARRNLFDEDADPSPATEVDDGTPADTEPIAVGSDAKPAGPVTIEWTYLPLIDGGMRAVTYGPGGFVAVGGDRASALVW